MSKKCQVLWAEVAEKDLVNIIDYIARKRSETALKILHGLKDKVAKLHFSSEQGRIVPELYDQGITKYRELVVPPWRVIFKRQESTVYIMAVIDSRRNIEDILLKRLVGGHINSTL